MESRPTTSDRPPRPRRLRAKCGATQASIMWMSLGTRAADPVGTARQVWAEGSRAATSPRPPSVTRGGGGTTAAMLPSVNPLSMTTRASYRARGRAREQLSTAPHSSQGSLAPPPNRPRQRESRLALPSRHRSTSRQQPTGWCGDDCTQSRGLPSYSGRDAHGPMPPVHLSSAAPMSAEASPTPRIGSIRATGVVVISGADPSPKSTSYRGRTQRRGSRLTRMVRLVRSPCSTPRSVGVSPAPACGNVTRRRRLTLPAWL
jgi:hypothetical protein